MASKSDIVPAHDLLSFQDAPGTIRLCPRKYRDIAEGVDLGEEIVIDIPPSVSMAFLDVADKSDPNNQLRVFCIRIGDKLAYKLILSDILGECDMRRLALMGFFMLGVEYANDVRQALSEAAALD